MKFPKKTIELIKQALSKQGITNKYLQVGIIAVVSTEGGFVPRSEMSYKNTNNKRLRILFGSRLPESEEQLTELKKDDVKFYDKIYGGKHGNNQVGDGFKYRGRGFNQITYKDLYKKYGDAIGVDLVNNPDRLNEIEIAADALAVFFKDGLKIGFSGHAQKRFGISSVDDIKDLQTATKVAFSCNAGWGTNWMKNEALAHENKIQQQNALEIETMLT